MIKYVQMLVLLVLIACGNSKMTVGYVYEDVPMYPKCQSLLDKAKTNTDTLVVYTFKEGRYFNCLWAFEYRDRLIASNMANLNTCRRMLARSKNRRDSMYVFYKPVDGPECVSWFQFYDTNTYNSYQELRKK